MRSLGLMTFMIPVGFSQACGITVGGFIGKGLEKALKYYYWTSMYLSVIVAGI
jgi:Na+-driven multidrug efflux pump